MQLDNCRWLNTPPVHAEGARFQAKARATVRWLGGNSAPGANERHRHGRDNHPRRIGGRRLAVPGVAGLSACAPASAPPALGILGLQETASAGCVYDRRRLGGAAFASVWDARTREPPILILIREGRGHTMRLAPPPPSSSRPFEGRSVVGRRRRSPGHVATLRRTCIK